MADAAFDLDGHVVIVTGATKGIGLGIARFLGQCGARLAITARRAERVDETISALRADGIEVVGRAGNIADRDAIDGLVDETVSAYGRIDGLVANAQTFRPVTPLEDVTPDDLDVLFGTGPAATLWAMQAVRPHMAARGRGRIVTMGSAIGLTGAPGYGPYAASKEAIRSLTRTAAREWGRHGILVNCVCPASVAHRLPSETDPDREAAFAAMYADHPLGRDGDAQRDIAPTVAFLLSDAAAYVTGQTLMVDGGGMMRA